MSNEQVAPETKGVTVKLLATVQPHEPNLTDQVAERRVGDVPRRYPYDLRRCP